jgi:hypothetical protein
MDTDTGIKGRLCAPSIARSNREMDGAPGSNLIVVFARQVRFSEALFLLVFPGGVVFAIETPGAFGAVFRIAPRRFGSDGLAVDPFEDFADGFARVLIGRGLADERSRDLKSIEEGSGILAVDVPAPEIAQYLVDGESYPGGIFGGGQREHAFVVATAPVDGTAREYVVVAESFSLQGGCLAFEPAGQDVSTLVIHS